MKQSLKLFNDIIMIGGVIASALLAQQIFEVKWKMCLYLVFQLCILAIVFTRKTGILLIKFCWQDIIMLYAIIQAFTYFVVKYQNAWGISKYFVVMTMTLILNLCFTYILRNAGAMLVVDYRKKVVSLLELLNFISRVQLFAAIIFGYVYYKQEMLRDVLLAVLLVIVQLIFQTVVVSYDLEIEK